MPALLVPGEPVPVRLMNTVWADRAGLHDDLASADDLRAWLAATGGPEDRAEVPVDGGDLERFRRLRDALRRLAAFQTADEREAAISPTREVSRAVEDVNDAMALVPALPLLEVRGGVLGRRAAVEADAAARRLSSVAIQAVELFTGSGRDLLRACHGPGCVLYFVKDHPRREWCSGGCGNRARAARHYARRREERDGSRSS